MDKRQAIREVREIRQEIPGHLRRARNRFNKALEGHQPSDVFIQATAGAVAASFCLRLLRVPPIGAVITRVAPMVVFAALYQYLLPKK